LTRAEGRQRAAAGLQRFLKDKDLLLARGMLAEATVALAPPRLPNPGTVYPSEREIVSRAVPGKARAVTLFSLGLPWR